MLFRYAFSHRSSFFILCFKCLIVGVNSAKLLAYDYRLHYTAQAKIPDEIMRSSAVAAVYMYKIKCTILKELSLQLV